MLLEHRRLVEKEEKKKQRGKGGKFKFQWKRLSRYLKEVYCVRGVSSQERQDNVTLCIERYIAMLGPECLCLPAAGERQKQGEYDNKK